MWGWAGWGGGWFETRYVWYGMQRASTRPAIAHHGGKAGALCADLADASILACLDGHVVWWELAMSGPAPPPAAQPTFS